MAEMSRSDRRENPSPTHPGPDEVIARLAGLAEQDLAESEFFGELLRGLVESTAGMGAAVWLWDNGRFRLGGQERLSVGGEAAGEHGARLEETLTGGECRTFRGGGPGAEILEILHPWRLADDDCGVLEFRREAEVSPAALAGQIRFVGVLADLVTAHRRSRRLADLDRREARWRRIDRFAQAVHRSTDLETTAYEVANEGRLLAGCDRVTVVVCRRGRWTAVAVSGSDRVNRRSPIIAQLELLAGPVAAVGSPIWSSGDGTGVPPELAGPVDDYQDLSSSRMAAFFPLSLPSRREDGRPTAGDGFAVLIFEQFTGGEPEEMRELCEAVGRHGASALEQAIRHDRMPLRRLSNWLDGSQWLTWFRDRPWSVVLSAAAVAAAVILSIVPAELRVEATGSLQPRTRRHLFAPVDGVVERLLVQKAGEPVRPDQELVLLRDPKLQFEMEGVLGELETARKQLAGLEAERLHSDRASRGDLRESALRSGEEESLRKQVEGLERQQALLEERREKLRVRSPLGGQLLTWEADELLQARPVARGQLLLTVGDLEGQWIVELEIPDDRIADVVEAVRSNGRPLTARFILATAPETRYVGRLESLSPSTDAQADRGPTVAATVVPDDQGAMRGLRPGASVVAKIECSRRSLLHVLSRGLLRTIRSRLLF
ncbi:MAG: HlyD family efflux transporter periplasmic adaptor subunit [Thermoguttaceae bacterium]